MRFSVVMPTYNRARVVGEALRSVALQRHKGVEVEFVVVDDSTDATLDVVRQTLSEYPDCALVIHRGATRLGCTGARNRGIELATGDVLIFLDSDDELLPCALSYMERFFTANPDVDVLFGAVRLKSGGTPRMLERLLDRRVSYEEVVSNDRVGEFLPIVRKRVFTESDLRYVSELDGFEGVLWRNIARRGYKVHFTSTPLRLYDDMGTDRNCDPEVRLRRANQLARGHVYELVEFGRDIRAQNEFSYQKKVAKAVIYNRLCAHRDVGRDDFLSRISPLIFHTIGLVPAQLLRRLFATAVRLYGR